MEVTNFAHLLLLLSLLSPSTVLSAAIGATQSDGEEEEVMALPDDVIIDALFANIDAVQDQVELCEEGLRQKLVAASGGKLPYVNDFEDVINKDSAGSIHSSNDNEPDLGVEETQHPDNGEGDEGGVNGGNEATGNDGEADADSTLTHSTRVKLTHSDPSDQAHKRRRRAVVSQVQGEKIGQGQSEGEGESNEGHSSNNGGEEREEEGNGTGNGEEVEEEEEEEENGDTNSQHHRPSHHHRRHHHHHQASPTETVVARLSERLEYLKGSLLRCYALYRTL